MNAKFFLLGAFLLTAAWAGCLGTLAWLYWPT